MPNGYRAILLAVLAAGPVRAADAPQAADVRAIEACVADAAKTHKPPETCVGRVYGACVERESTTAAMNACVDREFLVWDTRLNRAYDKLMGLLEPDAKPLLREIERLFISAKDKKCQFDYVANGGGTMWSTTGSECAAAETARQSLWLADKIDMLSPH